MGRGTKQALGIAGGVSVALAVHWGGTGNPTVDLAVQATAGLTAAGMALQAGRDALAANRRRSRPPDDPSRVRRVRAGRRP
jgi:hypothetical protein